MRTLVFAICVAVAAALWMAGNSFAVLHPVAHPSCHCKAKWDHRPYVYQSVVTITDSAGNSWTVPSRCRVDPGSGVTWCRIVSNG